MLNALLSYVLLLGRLYALTCTVDSIAFRAVCMGAPLVTAAAVLADLRSWRGAPVAPVPLQDPFRQQS